MPDKLTFPPANSNPNRDFKKYYGILDYFEKSVEIQPIKPIRNLLKPVLTAIFLATPLVSAWAWQGRQDQPPVHRNEAPTTQRLPVEIIASDTPPKWVLVPIDPG